MNEKKTVGICPFCLKMLKEYLEFVLSQIMLAKKALLNLEIMKIFVFLDLFVQIYI